MAEQRFFVIGGEYADTNFTGPAPGTELESYGPFNSEREAKVCWRDLTGKTVDNAMVRYFLKSEAPINSKIYWVVGGEYADSSFTRLAAGKELEVYGPYEKWEAVGFWRALTSKSVDDALVRYDIRENYEQGDGAGSAKMAAPSKGPQLAPTSTKAVTIAAPPAKVFAFLMDGRNWPKWAIHNVKSAHAAKDGQWDLETTRGSGRLALKGDQVSGVIDQVFTDSAGNAWSVPSRVVPGGGGAVFVSTFTKPAALTEAQFNQGLAQVDDELAALKRVVEAG